MKNKVHLDASSGGLEINTRETKYVFISHHQNTERNHDVKIMNPLKSIWDNSK